LRPHGVPGYATHSIPHHWQHGPKKCPPHTPAQLKQPPCTTPQATGLVMPCAVPECAPPAPAETQAAAAEVSCAPHPPVERGQGRAHVGGARRAPAPGASSSSASISAALDAANTAPAPQPCSRACSVFERPALKSSGCRHFFLSPTHGSPQRLLELGHCQRRIGRRKHPAPVPHPRSAERNVD